MTDYAELVAGNQPRLTVMLSRGPRGEEMFQVELRGQFPPLTLVGALCRAQVEIASGKYIPEMVDLGFAVVLCKDGARLFLHPDVPDDPLLGILEQVKAQLVAAQVVQQAQARGQWPGIVGPDGQPMRRGGM